MSSSTTDARVWLITGCSTGFGAALAEAVLARGDFAVVTARDPSKLAHLHDLAPDRCLPLALDVNDPAAVADVIARATDWQGRIDVLVNNAGYGLVGAVEEVDDSEARSLFETNVFGLMRVTRAVLPQMRARRGGCIVNISSMGGLVGFAGMGLYSASKFAVEGLSEALAAELRPLGIRVLIVEPGPFRTRFRGGLAHAARSIDDYADSAGKARKTMADPSIKPPGNPELAARAIITAVLAEQPPLRLPLGQMCYDMTRNKMKTMAEEMARWEAVAVATAFVEPVA